MRGRRQGIFWTARIHAMTPAQELVERPLNGLVLPSDLSSGSTTLQELLATIRRHLHRHPEIGLHEFETSRFIREVLEMHGLLVHGPLAGTGLYTDIVGRHPGPVVAYRADIDALPVQDQKDVAYASTNQGFAHLCGHDAHTTIAIGAALILDGRREEIHGTVRVFFQPNEEGVPSGSPLMIQDGVLNEVEAVFASHVDPTVDIGRFGLITGAATASADRFKIVVSGPSTGHSARPHQGVDTVWVATQIMTAIYQMVGRRTDARRTAVIAICRFRAGDAYNVIPQSVEFGGTFRCTAHDDRTEIKNLISEAASGIAAMHGAKAQVDFDVGCPPVMNDADLIRLTRDAIVNLFGQDAIYDIPVPSMGAEDFAHYLEKIPGVLLRIGTSSGPDTSYVLHNSRFDIDEASLEPASRLVSRVLLNYLQAA